MHLVQNGDHDENISLLKRALKFWVRGEELTSLYKSVQIALERGV